MHTRKSAILKRVLDSLDFLGSFIANASFDQKEEPARVVGINRMPHRA
jgi:hypothetical protein